MKIGKRSIGPGQPVYIIAELSANHNGSYDQAVELVHKAKEAGVDAVKVQTYTADTITFKSDKEWFRIQHGTLWDGRVLHDLYAEASMPWEWQPKLQREALSLGLDFFSAAFDPTAVDFLEKMNVPVHKVASFEIVDIPLIEKMAATRKPLIISTGMATMDEIGEAVTAAQKAGAQGVTLLKCTSAYPAPFDQMNLRTLPFFTEKFKVPAGLSDHTLGIAVPCAAVALGACMIEKHMTMSRSLPGPDSAFSLEPQEFKELVSAVRACEQALGKVQQEPNPNEVKSREFRRSLFIVKNIKKGERLTDENVRSIRPAHGLAPKYLKEILGRTAVCDLEAGTPLSWDMIGGRK